MDINLDNDKKQDDLSEQAPMDLTDGTSGSNDPRNAGVAGTSVEGNTGPEAEVRMTTDEEDELLQDSQTSTSKASEKKEAERPKLCGAARKRLRLLREQGVAIEEARKLCLIPLKESREELKKLNIPRKRGRSDGSTPDKPNANPPKKVANKTPTGTGDTHKRSGPPAQNSQPSYKDMAQVVRVAVIPIGFPDITWCDEELRKIQMAVLDKIVELKKGSVKPQFAGCSFKPGWLMFNCIGESAAKWVRENIPTIKPWDGAQLKVVAEDEVPRTEVFVGYFPEKPETSTQRILSLLEGQNDGLTVDLWKVLNRVSKGNVEELTLAIDPKSADRIRSKNLHVAYGYGKVHIRSTRQQKAQNDGRKETKEETRGSLPAARDSSSPSKCAEKPSGSKVVSEGPNVPSTSSACGGNETSKGLKLAEKPTCSKWTLVGTIKRKEPVKNTRPKKGHSATEEERVLNSSNRGRKMAKRANRR